MRNIIISLLLLVGAGAFASKFATTPIITGCDMSTASCSSTAVDLNQIHLVSMQAYWTGSPVGVLKVQVSTDNVFHGSQVTHWTDYTGSSLSISAAGDELYNMTFVGYRWARLVYTKTSGTGTLNAALNGKGYM